MCPTTIFYLRKCDQYRTNGRAVSSEHAADNKKGADSDGREAEKHCPSTKALNQGNGDQKHEDIHNTEIGQYTHP